MRISILLLSLLLAPQMLAAQQPNIVVVFIDDMGWGDFSCFGNRQAQTPNIDRVAAAGIRFEQFYVNAPICSPSRCALMTGQYPQRWRITSFLNNRADNERRGCAQWLDPQALTLVRLLQQHGYATGHFGKWHLGGQRDVSDAPPITRYGFDESLTNFEGMGPKLLPLTIKPGDLEPGRIWADAERLGGPVKWMQRSEITSGYVKAAIAFARSASEKNQPFYINVWPDDVHSPFWPPLDQWADKKRDKYLAVLESMDRQLSELFEFLHSTPKLRDNTLLLICSDNGPEPGAGSAGPFRGTKATLYEGGVRSPLIVWGPGLVEKSAVGKVDTTAVMAAFDIAPSLLSIANIDASTFAFDGENLASSLLGQENRSREAPLFWRRPPDRKTVGEKSKQLLPDLAMRKDEWKLLCNYDGTSAELYDLTVDRSESNNVAAEHRDLVQRMIGELTHWHRQMPPDHGPDLSP